MDTSIIPFIINVFWSLARGKKAGNNPWRALTLEWQTTSPPAIENFSEQPILWAEPYAYGADTYRIDSGQSVEELLAEVKNEVG
jgi:cytochrome c oxidase subunit I